MQYEHLADMLKSTKFLTNALACRCHPHELFMCHQTREELPGNVPLQRSEVKCEVPVIRAFMLMYLDTVSHCSVFKHNILFHPRKRKKMSVQHVYIVQQRVSAFKQASPGMKPDSAQPAVANRKYKSSSERLFV